jgi:hypothetical protein
VTSTRQPDTAQPASPDPGEVVAPTRGPSFAARIHLSDICLPYSLGLWIFALTRIDTARLGGLGLPAILPIAFYAAVVLLVLSAATELARPEPDKVRMSLHAIILVVILYGTAAIIYPEGRYSWLYKTIGVVQYVNAHGALNPNIDIYQNWPGFFAVAAWFDRIAGVASPLVYAKWSQLAFELAALPLLYLIYSALSLTSRQRWAAILLYSASNWIGQDYFSPQALGSFLGLGIMALVIRWLYLGRLVSEDGQLEQVERPAWRQTLGPCLVIMFIFVVLTFTHELSPYMITVQIGILMLLGLLRPRWLPFALGLIAVGFLIPRFGYVNHHFGLLKSLGQFFSNATPPAFDRGAVPVSQDFIERSAEALSLSMWGLALVGAWLRRRAGKTVLALVMLAFSPIVLLVLGAYGEEGILRVYLFSLPWTAALVAITLAPLPVWRTLPGKRRKDRKDRKEETRSVRERRRLQGTFAVPITLTVVLALFFPAFFGDDLSNVMTVGEVTSVTSFFESATPGRIYSPLDHSPLNDTWRYNYFPITALFGDKAMYQKDYIGKHIAARLAGAAWSQLGKYKAAYVVITPSMLAFNEAYQVTTTGRLSLVIREMSVSPYWTLLYSRGGTLIYRLSPDEP